MYGQLESDTLFVVSGEFSSTSNRRIAASDYKQLEADKNGNKITTGGRKNKKTSTKLCYWKLKLRKTLTVGGDVGSTQLLGEEEGRLDGVVSVTSHDGSAGGQHSN